MYGLSRVKYSRKSILARLIILAQDCLFLPQKQVGIIDKIFSRAGASDNIGMGQSTFVQMLETASILREH